MLFPCTLDMIPVTWNFCLSLFWCFLSDPISAIPSGATSMPVVPDSVSLLYLLDLVLRCSSPDAGAVDLSLVCCRSKLIIYVHFLYSAYAHGQPVSESIPRCDAPTHLLPYFLVDGVLHVSVVRVSSRSLSFSWAGLWSAVKVIDRIFTGKHVAIIRDDVELA